MPPKAAAIKAPESMYDRSIREYRSHAAIYGPNTAVFILVGSFYELYDLPDPSTGEPQTSMRRAVDILGIALKVKKGDGPGGRDGLFAGFPETQLHKFAALLTRENWTVVVIDQIKSATGTKVLERQVARILSPATHIEAAGGAGGTTAADNLFLAGVWLEPEGWGTAAAAAGALAAPPLFAAAALDLTTGELHTYEGRAVGRAAAWSADDLLHFFQVHPAKEVVVWWRGDAIDMPEETALRAAFGAPAALIHRRVAGAGLSDSARQGALEKPLVREDLLRRCFQPKSVLPLRQVLGLAERPHTERVLAALLTFVEDHFPSAMERLHHPVNWNPRDAMFLGNHALTQLNMVCAREEDSVLAMFLRTLTPIGRRALRARLLYPICVVEELERRWEEVDWAAAAGTDHAAAAALRCSHDVSKLHRRVATGAVGAVEVLGLDMSYRSCVRAAAALQDATPLKMPAALADEMSILLERFGQVFSVEKALESSEDLFCLTAEAGPKCAALEEELAATKAQLESTYQELVEWLGETPETLRMEFKELCVVLTGGKGLMARAEKKFRSAAAAVPAKFQGTQIHAKKSTSSMEVPTLNAAFGKLLRLRERLVAAAREEVRPVCDALTEEFADTWDALEEWIGRVDCSFTLGRVAVERGFCRPRLAAVAAAAGEPCASSLKATGLRHPLIEAQQTRVEYVRHNVELGAAAAAGAAQGWLVYGMNASGKSSLMKSVGIAVLLAQAGSFVPATSFEFVPFGSLFTRILNTDNLWAGLSSFAVEMTELREILARADSRSLVLGDEVCSGTESVSATALVGASLRWLTKRGARYIFATHLHGLQALPEVSELPGLRVWHLRVRYDAATDRLLYDRTLHPGAGSSLYGLEVAKAMALPLEVLEDAHAIRRALAGTTAAGDAPASSWNAAVVRRECELCHAAILRDLEVHHIQERATATAAGRLADGTHMNSLRNLVVVCQTCHDRHHAGELAIGCVKQTSDGPVREVVDLSRFAYTGTSGANQTTPRAAGLSEEQLQTVSERLRRYPKLDARRIAFDLEHEDGIRITVQRLRTLRATL